MYTSYHWCHLRSTAQNPQRLLANRDIEHISIIQTHGWRLLFVCEDTWIVGGSREITLMTRFSSTLRFLSAKFARYFIDLESTPPPAPIHELNIQYQVPGTQYLPRRERPRNNFNFLLCDINLRYVWYHGASRHLLPIF